MCKDNPPNKQWVTVVAKCHCGCDNDAEVYHLLIKPSAKQKTDYKRAVAALKHSVKERAGHMEVCSVLHGMCMPV